MSGDFKTDFSMIRPLKVISLLLVVILCFSSTPLTGHVDSYNSAFDSHLIFGTATWSEGGNAVNALVVVSSSLGSLSGQVDAYGDWFVDTNGDWPDGTSFTVRITGCCAHLGDTGLASGTISGAENDMGNIVVYPNQPPTNPSTPAGNPNGEVGVTSTFSTSSTDPEGHRVMYRFDFDAAGLHDLSEWIGPFDSGFTGIIDYVWGAPGTYLVKAQAKDVYNEFSDWSDGFVVTVTGTNNKPYINVGNLSGPSELEINESGDFSVAAIDPEGSQVRYQFDWGDEIGNWTRLYDSGEVITLQHSWNQAGYYYVKVKAKDKYEAESSWTQAILVTIEGDNIPPSQPSITGPSSSRTSELLEFTVTGNDADGEQLFYYIDWGDNMTSGWIGPFEVGENITVSHSYADPIQYHLKVKSEDTAGAESIWSDEHIVEVFSGPDIELREPVIGTETIEFSIQNIGDLPAEELQWSLTIDGGFFFGERSSSDTYGSLEPDAVLSVSSTSLIGIGRLRFSVEFESLEQSALRQNVDVFLLWKTLYEPK